jgi:hypothetical protein
MAQNRGSVAIGGTQCSAWIAATRQFHPTNRACRFLAHLLHLF